MLAKKPKNKQKILKKTQYIDKWKFLKALIFEISFPILSAPSTIKYHLPDCSSCRLSGFYFYIKSHKAMYVTTSPNARNNIRNLEKFSYLIIYLWLMRLLLARDICLDWFFSYHTDHFSLTLAGLVSLFIFLMGWKIGLAVSQKPWSVGHKLMPYSNVYFGWWDLLKSCIISWICQSYWVGLCSYILGLFCAVSAVLVPNWYLVMDEK